LCLVVAEELVLLTQVQLLHPRNEHLRYLLFLNPIVNLVYVYHLSLSTGSVLEVDCLVHLLSELLKLRITRYLGALYGYIEWEHGLTICGLLLDHLFNLLDAEFKDVRFMMRITETLLEEADKGIKDKVLQQRHADIGTSLCV
jgi:hypothetical protein